MLSLMTAKIDLLIKEQILNPKKLIRLLQERESDK